MNDPLDVNTMRIPRVLAKLTATYLIPHDERFVYQTAAPSLRVLGPPQKETDLHLIAQRYIANDDPTRIAAIAPLIDMNELLGIVVRGTSSFRTLTALRPWLQERQGCKYHCLEFLDYFTDLIGPSPNHNPTKQQLLCISFLMRTLSYSWSKEWRFEVAVHHGISWYVHENVDDISFVTLSDTIGILEESNREQTKIGVLVREALSKRIEDGHSVSW
ncbi:MAG: hypothetical protein KGL39_10475 [Patescibacteria group bacterium]|nr:hypothetical protein [Patescibacteria group bacterium]